MAISCIGSLKGRGAIVTPRSLVGMTQGCRKRVVRARCWEAGYTLRRNRFSLTSDQLRALDVTERAECAKIRENYRIGQRLRPCPGCHRKHCEEWSSGKRLTATDSDKLVAQALRRWTNNSAGTFCDGSGVLPARAKKVRR